MAKYKNQEGVAMKNLMIGKDNDPRTEAERCRDEIEYLIDRLVRLKDQAVRNATGIKRQDNDKPCDTE